MNSPNIIPRIFGLISFFLMGGIGMMMWRDPEGLIGKLEDRIEQKKARRAKWIDDYGSKDRTQVRRGE